MMGRGVLAVPQTNEESLPKVPVGFTPIFNGKDLTGWHISKTNHHGTTPDYRVLHGLIVATQQPFGQGGILLTDKKYRNVEVYMEVKPDWGCDGGLFFWADEAGPRLPGHAGLPARRDDGGRRLRRDDPGRQHERAWLGEPDTEQRQEIQSDENRDLAEGLEAGSVEQPCARGSKATRLASPRG